MSTRPAVWLALLALSTAVPAAAAQRPPPASALPGPVVVRSASDIVRGRALWRDVIGPAARASQKAFHRAFGDYLCKPR
jgi:hypothetical protein